MDEHEKTADLERRIALDARDWIVRLTSGDVSDAALQRFKAWRDLSPQHRLAFERERVFWQQLQSVDAEADGLSPLARPHAATTGVVRRRAFLAGGGAVAATAIAAVSVPRLRDWWSADFTTAVGEQAEIALPDGSLATLNTDSAIAVDFTSQLRLVTLLKGEAGFNIHPGPTQLFRVAALGGNSDTLQTRFSVKSVEGVATVTVEQGEVRVAGQMAPTALYDKAPGEVRLAANQQTSYLAGERPRTPLEVDTDLVMAWRSGRLIFEGRKFSAAMAEIGRYVPERIVLGPLARPDIPVSAIFSTRNAYDAVQALAKTQGLTARRIPGVMIILT
jgi:transmembrane sensor